MTRNLNTATDRARAGTLTMDTKSLAAGIYLVRLETARGSATPRPVIDAKGSGTIPIGLCGPCLTVRGQSQLTDNGAGSPAPLRLRRNRKSVL